MIDYSRLPEVARSYLGTRFCHQGRSREQGVDCIGFILLVYGELGWVERSAGTTNILNYGPEPFGRMLVDCLELEASQIKWVEQQQGDLVLMRYARDPQHVGILLSRPGGMNIIHATREGVIEHIFDQSWRSRTTGVYRIKES